MNVHADGAAVDNETDIAMNQRPSSRRSSPAASPKASPRGAVSDQHSTEETTSDPLASRLESLLQKTDELLRGGVQNKSGVVRRGGRGGGRAAGSARSRHAEKEEDQNLLAEEAGEDESGVVPTRLSKQPSCITGEMREYQLEGLNWLIGLYDKQISGILADEMGLGKTLQSISLLGYLKEIRGIKGPHLILSPKSTLSNWMRECARWCPSLSVTKVIGDESERKEALEEFGSQDHNILVTSYEMAVKEKSALKKFDWHHIIIDEAHRIKNEHSVLSQVVRTLPSKHRLLITGTPLQNNLHELWALLNFLLPEIFADSSVFDELFADNLHADGVVHRLHALLKPFILRRLKADVEKRLLPKKETKLYVPMTAKQRQVYAAVLGKDLAAVNSMGGRFDRSRLLNILVQLRKACNHPYLFEGVEPGPPFLDGSHLWESCGKMLLLERLLKRLQSEGHRVLIFTQMTRMLDILEDFCRLKQYQYSRLDGQTSSVARDIQIDSFNAVGSDKFIFLLSTRAGGLGVNLQTADTVILYDSDFNPQMDLQAQDRAHRVGQTKAVRVFRLITDKSVEEKIVERAEKKLYLDAAVIQQGRLMSGAGSKLSSQEVMNMVRFGAEEVFKPISEEFSDKDIDAILLDGEQRTAELLERIKTNMQHTLSNFVFDGSTAEEEIFTAEAAQEASEIAFTPLIIDLGKRERINRVTGKPAEDPLETEIKMPKEPKLPKTPQMPEYQFWHKPQMEEAIRLESQALMDTYGAELRLRDCEIKAEKARRLGRNIPTDSEGRTECDRIRAEVEWRKSTAAAHANDRIQLTAVAFPDWGRREFKLFVSSCERHGRTGVEFIIRDMKDQTGKPREEVLRYMESFFSRFNELENGEAVMQRIDRGQAKNAKRDTYNELIRKELSRHAEPLKTLSFDVRKIGDCWQDSQDRIMIVLLNELGYGQWEALRDEIQKTDSVRCDWFLRTRSPSELQNRCDRLLRALEKEGADGAFVPSPKVIPPIWLSAEAEAEANSGIKRRKRTAEESEKLPKSAKTPKTRKAPKKEEDKGVVIKIGKPRSSRLNSAQISGQTSPAAVPDAEITEYAPESDHQLLHADPDLTEDEN